MTDLSRRQPPDARAQRSRWRRPGTWALLVVSALGVWLMVSLALAGWHAKQAASAMSDVAAQIAAGEPESASDAIETARTNTQAARSALTSMPVELLNVVPYFRTNLAGADAFTGAALALLDAADEVSEVYPKLSGGAGRAVLRDGAVDFKALKRIQPQIDQASEDLTAAVDHLDGIPKDISPALRRYVEEASPQIRRIHKALRVAGIVLPELPTLLGENRPATYLVVFHNPSELYAGGGAALNLALVEFNKGRMKVLDRGDIAHFHPLGERVPWNPKAGGPYYAETGATDGFAWSNLHQDFRIAGEDMMRSWVASGQQPVDGIISLDPAALAAAVAATGPIQSKFYGRITEDNLVRKLLYKGYLADPTQQRRHQINVQLIDEMLSRMQRGDTTLTIGRAILATAPGQHIRIHLSDNRLSEALREAQLDGAQPAPAPDRIAFYTQNQNSSKIDVFQTRRVVHDVHLDEDGSATVVQTAEVTNAAPRKGGSPLTERTGYTTRWAFHWNIVLLPENAEDVRLSANPGQIKTDEQVYTDVDGRKAVRVGRWIPPGGSSYITASYRLPAGTFGTEGNLEYRVGVEHQLTVKDVELAVNVSGPSRPRPLEGNWVVDADQATAEFPVSQPTTLALAFGD